MIFSYVMYVCNVTSVDFWENCVRSFWMQYRVTVSLWQLSFMCF